MKLWEKGISTEASIENFTVGNDRHYDRYLAIYDVKASAAHARMLHKCGFLELLELNQLLEGLSELEEQVALVDFSIPERFEDIHSYIEYYLTDKYGSVGKKIHTARSRNDQVITALQLYVTDSLDQLIESTADFARLLLELSEKHRDILMPGYTHLQVAMPSSFGLWLSAYAETLCDDIVALKAAAVVSNQNPLGSAAGYGSNFGIDRLLTTELIGFEVVKVNSIASQTLRGRIERIAINAIAQLGATLSKLAGDICLYMGQDFGFLSFDDEITTGSSIMPHKKNPDVFELIRAKGNALQGVSVQISTILANLPTGYHRDLQLTKPMLIDSFLTIEELLSIFSFSLSKMTPSKALLEQEKYTYLWSVDTLNSMVSAGMPFRDAYKKMAEDIATNNYVPNKEAAHTHLGSIGNLGLDLISKKLEAAVQSGNYSGLSSEK